MFFDYLKLINYSDFIYSFMFYTQSAKIVPQK